MRNIAVRLLLGAFAVIHAVMAALFAVAALVLLVIAAKTGFEACLRGLNSEAAMAVIEAVGLLAAGVVALQISQTIAEEEVIRAAHVSAPTRVRRFLSRFFVVVVVALAIESVVATFKAVHEDLALLLDAGALLAGTALLLGAWGLFIRHNRAAEELEPEAMQEAKDEDRKLGPGKPGQGEST